MNGIIQKYFFFSISNIFIIIIIIIIYKLRDEKFKNLK